MTDKRCASISHAAIMDSLVDLWVRTYSFQRTCTYSMLGLEPFLKGLAWTYIKRLGMVLPVSHLCRSGSSWPGLFTSLILSLNYKVSTERHVQYSTPYQNKYQLCCAKYKCFNLHRWKGLLHLVVRTFAGDFGHRMLWWCDKSYIKVNQTWIESYELHHNSIHGNINGRKADVTNFFIRVAYLYNVQRIFLAKWRANSS